MLLAEKSPKIFPKHKGYFFCISESFALNWDISVVLTNKNYFHYNEDLNKIFYLILKK